jgi:hypothetical protein
MYSKQKESCVLIVCMKCCDGDYIREDKMGGARGTRMGEQKHMQDFW